MWSQLTIGWQWSEPDTAGHHRRDGRHVRRDVVFAVLALLAAVPVAGRCCRGWPAGGPRGCWARPRSSWPAWRSVRRRPAFRERLAGHRGSSLGAPGPGAWRDGGVLVGVDALRLRVLGTSGRSGGFPRPRWRGWPLSPVAWPASWPGGHGGAPDGALTAGPAVRGRARRGGLRRDGRIPQRLLPLDRRRGPGPRNLFHAGAIDVVGTAVMAVALAVAGSRAQARAGAARPGRPDAARSRHDMTERTGRRVAPNGASRRAGLDPAPGAGGRAGARRRCWPAPGSPGWSWSPMACCRARACSTSSTAPARSRARRWRSRPSGRRSRARSTPQPAAGRSATRSPIRPATAPATSCRWW